MHVDESSSEEETSSDTDVEMRDSPRAFITIPIADFRCMDSEPEMRDLIADRDTDDEKQMGLDSDFDDF